MIGQVTKSKVERRLQKLEAVLMADSLAVPHAHKWLIYWTQRIGNYMSEERKPVAPFIPLEAYCAVMTPCEAAPEAEMQESCQISATGAARAG